MQVLTDDRGTLWRAIPDLRGINGARQSSSNGDACRAKGPRNQHSRPAL
jgi:hypothetical protein